jgi:hypothetical protein
MNSLAKSYEYINCLRGFPVPETTNGVPFSNTIVIRKGSIEVNDKLRPTFG